MVAQPVGGLGPEGLVGGVPAQLVDQGQLGVGAQVDAGQLGRPVEDLGVAGPDLLQVGDGGVEVPGRVEAGLLAQLLQLDPPFLEPAPLVLGGGLERADVGPQLLDLQVPDPDLAP